MTYNKRQHLIRNTEAIHTAFEIIASGRPATHMEKELLRSYSGFGGLKCILLLCDNPEDRKQWNKSEAPLFPLVQHLHAVLREHSGSDEEYKRYVSSMKNSILTAFYTPKQIPEVIGTSLKDAAITANRILDPSAGTGVFTDAFINTFAGKATCFENDLLTGKILSALYPEEEVYIKGFEEIDPALIGSFDLISSNIPFGDFATFDPAFADSRDKVKQQAAKAIHNYFFLKAVDSIRDGGIIAFITSQGMMNAPVNDEIRQRLMEECRLVSAIRLPNNLFLETANTKVGSDLVILQRDTAKQSISPEEEAFVKARVLSNGVTINNYYGDMQKVIHTHAKMGKDQYGKPAMEFSHDGGAEVIAQKLSALLSVDLQQNLDIALYDRYKAALPSLEHTEDISSVQSLPQPVEENTSLFGLYDLFGISSQVRDKMNTQAQTISDRKVNDPEKASLNNTDVQRKMVYTGELEPFYKNGAIVFDRGLPGYLRDIHKGVAGFEYLRIERTQVARIKDYVPLRDAYLRLFEAEAETQQEQPLLRKELNDLYKVYTDKHGELNSPNNFAFIMLDAYGREIMSLEYFENGEMRLADIFKQPVSFMGNRSLEVNTADEALAASVNKWGEVNLSYMSAVSGIEEEELLTELKGRIYYNPLTAGYEIADRFVAGDVIEKREQIEAWLDNHPNSNEKLACEESLKALQLATPEAIPFADLDFNFGERWMPLSHYNSYAKELFNTDVLIRYSETLDDYSVEADKHTIEITEKFAVSSESRTYNGLHLMGYALVNTIPQITKTEWAGDKEIKIPDTEAIQLATSKIDEIRNGFSEWLNRQSPDFKEDLQELYNRKFNARVRPAYNGQFQTFPDLQLRNLGIYKLYESQKDAAWMLKLNDGGIVDHEVGLGKTLTICITAYEMKRLKMANKPMIIALKANVHEIAETFNKAYPNAKVLYPTEKEFEPENRARLFNRIKNNNWDAVVLTHDQFMKIPQSLDVQKTILQNEIDSLEEDLHVLERKTGVPASKAMLKGLEKREKNLMAKLSLIHHKMEKRRDDSVDFRNMGIDHLFVDESHYFKNLTFTTRSNRVAGLGNPEGSQRALNLLYAIRTIQMKKDRDLCATFLSGTTISNSLTELYLLFKYLRPKALEAQGIKTFDAWVAIFAKKTTDFEFTVTNEIKQKERFRYFIKVPELAGFYNEITDFRTAEKLKIDRPELNEILHNIPQTPEQKAFIKLLIEFANNGDGSLIGRPELSESELRAKMLLVTSYAAKASLDMRLIDEHSYNDHYNNKASHCADKINTYYKQYDKQKGTQFVFSDLGTYNPEKWNVYEEIKRKLTEDYGIPKDEIRYMQEAKNLKQRRELIDGMKKGDIRVLFGSTSMLGTGVNAQKRAVCIHHIDLPWVRHEVA